jgi:hypothetical protein
VTVVAPLNRLPLGGWRAGGWGLAGWRASFAKGFSGCEGFLRWRAGAESERATRCSRLAMIYCEDFSGHEEFPWSKWEKVFAAGKVFMVPVGA